MPTPRAVSDRPLLLLSAWGVTLAAAIAATWRLWTPYRATPQIAPFEFLAAVPLRPDFLLLGVMSGCVVRAIARPADWRRSVGVATAALVALMAFDQLRWQPWAYHAALAGAILAGTSTATAYRWLRLVTVAVYAFSAFAKLDAEFAATLGPQMLGVVGLPPRLALLLPIGELGVAVLLAASLRWKHLQLPAGVAAAVMHAATIGVLGPWALDHSLGVLFWNAGFALQTLVLFGLRRPLWEDSADRPRLAAIVALGLAVVAPLQTPLGLWDQWPGWALYAPGGERATLYVHSAAADRLPESLQSYIDDDVNNAPSEGPWRRVRVDDWALAATGAPIYPQNRIVAAIASGLAERYPLTGRLRVVAESEPHRLTRERTRQTLDGEEAIGEASKLLGVTPGVRWSR
ncbi:hypothetical protein Pla108_37970 [Botrimarina colliarenosi]|uniref:Uncharacterized protein n=1 Tax=Botrimarina colliarenosi TaxID=2528001 RepID=A0A5C6A3Y5_9BACT|nr:hypothetical protein [Botrimarina colliarenosi]TWT94085.1 hypothetical protein Pla108_37970 [Botrimarina colliarenosi]